MGPFVLVVGGDEAVPEVDEHPGDHNDAVHTYQTLGDHDGDTDTLQRMQICAASSLCIL